MSLPWVTSDLIKGKTRQFLELKTIENWVIWLERSSESQGKRKLFGYDLSQGKKSLNPLILSPENADISAKVNEYGGGSWVGYWHKEKECLVLFYADSKRSGVWQATYFPKNPEKNEEIQLIKQSPLEETEVFYADFALDFQKKGLFGVKESRFLNGKEKNEIIYLSLAENSLFQEKILFSGEGFFAAPRPSKDSKYLAFIEWQVGEMPWTKTQLKILSLENPKTKSILLAGEKGQESLMEPHWDENNLKLYALSDQQGAWNPVAFELFKEKETLKSKRKDFPICPEEIGMPAWQFSQNSLHILAEDAFLGRSLSHGVGRIWHFEKNVGWQQVSGIFPSFIPEQLKNGDFACLNAAPDAPSFILRFSFSQNGKIEKSEILRQSWDFPESFSVEDISIPQTIEITLSEEVLPLRALYYPATSRTLLQENKPPLIVKVHGGPTGSAQGALDLRIQYWTSRGFAVLEVDYRGSAGYGRAYREALNGKWGLLDVQDCCLATQYLLDKNLVDQHRCVIRGSSAGGLTALAALSLENSPFRAACSLYGVTDLSALVGEGPRFEAHYVEGLVGKYPKEKRLFEERSPIFWPERLSAPILFLHGGQDRVVPAEQAKKLAEQLPKAAFHLYPEAGHGFRDPEIMTDALSKEMDFYLSVFKKQAQENGYEGSQ